MKLLNNVTNLLLRTNPLLSSNVKLTIIGEDEFELNSYDADEILLNKRYKRFKLNPNSKLGFNLFKFWEGTSKEVIFKTYKPNNLSSVTKNPENQNFSFYEYGAERLNSYL
jgi:hypothetical protein